MSDLTFVTGNSLKFEIASHAFKEQGLVLVQKKLDIDEVQSEDSEYITKKKAEAAFRLLQKPVVVNDDTWAFLGLRGFPGPYMKSMNHWFSAQDWERLTKTVADRRVILTQIIVYQDEHGQQLLRNEIPGVLLSSVRGNSADSSHAIISLQGDDGLSIAEAIAKDAGHYNERSAGKLWREFASRFKGTI
jgi:inosine/xanthosine triphosphate pyrophosphatase family protein